MEKKYVFQRKRAIKYIFTQNPLQKTFLFAKSYREDLRLKKQMINRDCNFIPLHLVSGRT